MSCCARNFCTRPLHVPSCIMVHPPQNNHRPNWSGIKVLSVNVRSSRHRQWVTRAYTFRDSLEGCVWFTVNRHASNSRRPVFSKTNIPRAESQVSASHGLSHDRVPDDAVHKWSWKTGPLSSSGAGQRYSRVGRRAGVYKITPRGGRMGFVHSTSCLAAMHHTPAGADPHCPAEAHEGIMAAMVHKSLNTQKKCVFVLDLLQPIISW